MWLSAAETQRDFLKFYGRSVLSIERVATAMFEFTYQAAPLLKAATFAMYAWGAFAVALSVATVVNLLMTVF